MRFLSRAPKRALVTAAGTAVALSIGLASGAGSAWAHVHVDADDPVPGSTSLVTFQVPDESDNGSVTTKLSIALPNVASARTEVMPGWTASLVRDKAAGTVSSVTWTANPQVGISSDEFALFRLSVKLPEGDSVTFPATQTYSDGTVVRWDQPPLPDGGEPEHPAPVLSLTGAAPTANHDHDMTAQAAPAASSAPAPPADNVARWLAGGALILAALGVATAFVTRRRT